MWIFTRSGFFSVVAHRESTDAVLVRSRWRWPLANLLATCPPAGGGILAGRGIIEIPGDYRYRVAVRRADFAIWLACEAEAIDYDNFKSAAHDIPAWSPAMDALHDIWGVLARAARAATRRPEHPRPGKGARPTSAPALKGPGRPPRQIGLPL